MSFKITLLFLPSHLEWLCACFLSLLGHYVISCNIIFQTFTLSFKIKFLPLPSHLELFYACFVRLLGHYVISCSISHLSCTFQTLTTSFKIKLLPLLSHLEWFYVCIVSLLGLLCMFNKFMMQLYFICSFLWSGMVLPIGKYINCCP